MEIDIYISVGKTQLDIYHVDGKGSVEVSMLLLMLPLISQIKSERGVECIQLWLLTKYSDGKRNSEKGDNKYH